MRSLYLALACLLLAACSREPSLPAWQLARFEPADYHGRWVIINYWAQWCKPCIQEIPELNHLADSDPRLAVLGVNFDGVTGPELEQQVASLGIAFPLLLEDPAQQLGIERPSALPTTVIVDPEGGVRATLVGPQTEESLTAATLGAGAAAP